jgi:hypothetical protein
MTVFMDIGDNLSNGWFGGVFSSGRLAGLATAAAVLLFAFSKTWHYLRMVKLPDDEFPGQTERERRFLKRQAWRRLQTAALSGIAGLCMLGGLFVPFWYRKTFTLLWVGVFGFGLWGVALALVDSISTWIYFGEERQIHEAERLALRYKMEKFHQDALRERDRAEAEEAANRVAENEEED